MSDKPRPNAIPSLEGDSRDVLRTFPEEVRSDLSFSLWQLEQHFKPSNSKPMTSIGKGVFELKEGDEATW